jgi:type I restriction enzyme M protein
MAIKKSDLYSSLWASCDELRGGMDASQYKDYVLFMLFIKYISDKYGDSDDFAPPVVIPRGASFKDMVDLLKGKSDIGDKINTQVIQPLIDANCPAGPQRLSPTSTTPTNSAMGQGRRSIEARPTSSPSFENPALDFSKNRAEHDDILGDAYEYLMRHFATESGKSKGQFYTPSEVSRIMAKVIGISAAQLEVAATTAYDPTCGSGSLLLESGRRGGQAHHARRAGEGRDHRRSGPHEHDSARFSDGQRIISGNTLASSPSSRTASSSAPTTTSSPIRPSPTRRGPPGLGRRRSEDPFQRFAWGVPPAKQGDYAYLLHIIRSHQEHRQRRLHPAPRRSLPRQCRGHHPASSSSVRAS